MRMHAKGSRSQRCAVPGHCDMDSAITAHSCILALPFFGGSSDQHFEEENRGGGGGGGGGEELGWGVKKKNTGGKDWLQWTNYGAFNPFSAMRLSDVLSNVFFDSLESHMSHMYTATATHENVTLHPPRCSVSLSDVYRSKQFCATLQWCQSLNLFTHSTHTCNDPQRMSVQWRQGLWLSDGLQNGWKPGAG